MIRPRLELALLLAAGAPAARAAPLAVSRTTSVVADGLGGANPRALPGADIACAVTVTNPTANVLASVTTVVIVDTVPAAEKMRVADYGAAGSGPVAFVDGNLLNLGLLGSGLQYRFAALGSTADGIEFSDGKSWSYVPVADADGFDANVRAIRVTLTGAQASGSGFQLRYRTRLR